MTGASTHAAATRSGRHVLVTGGSTGIGLASAEAFGRTGDRVTIVARSPGPLKKAETDLRAAGIKVLGVSGSVADVEDVERMVEVATERFGPVDVLVNNAGIGTEGLIAEMPVEQWQEVLDINLTGVFLPTRRVVKAMLEQHRPGVILVTGSINALMPRSPAVAYASSKAAIDAFVRGLGAELGPAGVRVCGVHPGYIETPLLHKVYTPDAVYQRWVEERTALIPLGRLGTAEEIASVFLFLASEAASYISATSVVVDGGRTPVG